ncbi:phytoene/squalene synthase family protein [candidate division WWE3 bacterium]|nr:phytoene/squalene synthase family protein [candidate division WWE3 bacterium]
MISANLSRIFFNGSRTYFFSSIFFPPLLRDDVFVLYSFVRTVDNFVDTIPQQKNVFNQFKYEYYEHRNGKPSSSEVIRSFHALSIKHQFPYDWPDAFIAAMEADLTIKKYETLEQLDMYMYGSAEVIGLMMAKMMKLPEESYSTAQLLGKSMQYINFIRDITEDNSFGRQYIPQEQLDEFSLTDLSYEHTSRHKEAFVSCIKKQIELYWSWEEKARTGFTYIPNRYQGPIQTANDMYRWTADQIYKDPLIVFVKKIKPSPTRILSKGIQNYLTRSIM